LVAADHFGGDGAGGACTDNDTLVQAAAGVGCATAVAVRGCGYNASALLAAQGAGAGGGGGGGGGGDGTTLLGDLCPASCGLCGGGGQAAVPCSAERDDEGHYALYSQDHDADPATPPRCSGYTYSTFQPDGSDINLYTAFAYDSLYTVAIALDGLLRRDPAARAQVGGPLLPRMLPSLCAAVLTGMYLCNVSVLVKY
jgi:hypothetical protein